MFLIQDIRAKVEERLNSKAPGLLKQFPITHYLCLFEADAGFGNYRAVPVEATEICEEIIQIYGDPVLWNYHRLVILELIGQLDKCADQYAYPAEVRTCLDSYLRGIIKQVDKNPESYYRHENDLFAKDFAVCRHKLVPCGAQLVDVYSGIPRSTALQGGLSQFAAFVSFMLLRTRGFRPLYEMHMDSRLILEFNQKGWEHCYMRIAKMLKVHPEMLGVCGTSWWFDPKIKSISPRLAFLQDIPAEGGGAFFRVAEDKASTSSALINAPERQRAYEEGAYCPTIYSMVWARNDLIAWAASHSA